MSKTGKAASIRRALYTALLSLSVAPAAWAFSFSGGGGGGYGATGNSGYQPGGGPAINTTVQSVDTTVLLIKGLSIDVCTLVGIILVAMGLHRVTKDKERGENHHVGALKMILVGGAMASIGVFMMMTVNAIYT